MRTVAGDVEVSGHTRHHDATLQTASLLIRSDVQQGEIG